MNRYLFEQFSSIFNKGNAFSIMLVLQQENPAFYDNVGINTEKYKKLTVVMRKIRMSFPYVELYSFKNVKYKIVIFDNTKNSLESVRNIYENRPVTKSEINERIKLEAKLLGYPSILVNVENTINSRRNNVNLKWYYVTYILTEKDKNVGDIYTFFCKGETMKNIQEEIKERKEIYNNVLGNLKDYKVLLCIEEKTFKIIIF